MLTLQESAKNLRQALNNLVDAAGIKKVIIWCLDRSTEILNKLGY